MSGTGTRKDDANDDSDERLGADIRAFAAATPVIPAGGDNVSWNFRSAERPSDAPSSVQQSAELLDPQQYEPLPSDEGGRVPKAYSPLPREAMVKQLDVVPISSMETDETKKKLDRLSLQPKPDHRNDPTELNTSGWMDSKFDPESKVQLRKPEPKQTWNAPGAENMRCLPLYYPADTLLQVAFYLVQFLLVVDTLLNTFHGLSLEVQYQTGDGQTTSVAAFCKCMNGTQFRVQLWKKQQGTSEATECLVEIQRTAGNPMLFYPLARAVLQAVEDAVRPSAGTQSPSSIAEMTTDRFVRDTKYDRESQNVWDSFFQQVGGTMLDMDAKTSSAVEAFAEQVLSKACDAIHSGFSGIITMTDVSQSGLTTALEASRHLISQCSSNASQSILCLALDGNWPRSVPMAANDMRLHFEMRRHHSYLSLTIVAQALSVFEKAEVDEFLKHARDWELDVVDSLLRDVDKAEDAPHTAYLATHILTCLCRFQPEIRAKVDPHTKSVQMANHVGECGHAALAQASDRLLSVLLTEGGDMEE